MKLSVMQPYIFPYIGYFQLIHASDLFVIYDDVTYIKQGYINRNSILARHGSTRFTLPVPGASSNKLICDLHYSADVSKTLKSIEQSYSKAPYFHDVFPLVQHVLQNNDRAISSVCQLCYQSVLSYLGIERQIEKASQLEYDRCGPAIERLISLCRHFGADCYINSTGGRFLYSKSAFSTAGVELRFVESLQASYAQSAPDFVPNLSIIDVIMNCSRQEVIDLIAGYELG